jgi:hypothetical protein
MCEVVMSLDPVQAGAINPGGDAAATVDDRLVRARVIRLALLLWPGLDRRTLRRTGGDTGKIARLVARRTVLPEAVIERMLGRNDRSTGG